MIELNDDFELAWLDYCLHEPHKIKVLPVALYHKFFDYLVQENRLTDAFNLGQVKGKVVHQTLEEIFENSPVIYSSSWTIAEAARQYNILVETAHELSDDELSQRAELMNDCVPVTYMLPSHRLDVIIRDRITSYCMTKGISIDEYDGPFNLKTFKHLF